MATEQKVQRQKSGIKASIPRSHSDFCYVSLTPKEKRRTTDFSHLLPQFNKDPPYVRLLDPKVPIMEQPKPALPSVAKISRSSTASPVSKSPTLDVIRSHSMRSLRRTLEMSPTKYRVDNPVENEDPGVTEGTPENHNQVDIRDMTRLRNFTVTPKGVVNWGDSFRSRSMPFVPIDQPSCSDVRISASSSVFYSENRLSPSDCASASYTKQPTKYRIVVLGSSNVGKTTMIRQFRTSEYICAFDSSISDDSSDYALTVILNGEESELEFIDSCSMENETDEEGQEGKEPSSKLYIPTADAYVILYSVTSRRSYLHAIKLLSNVQSNFLNSPVLLVGNKSDLVRIRAVTTDEGRTSSKEHNCQFMETSVAINHQVDELLVAILTEIRSKTDASVSLSAKYSPQCNFTKAKGLIKRFLKKACFQSKSCDNLQRL